MSKLRVDAGLDQADLMSLLAVCLTDTLVLRTLYMLRDGEALCFCEIKEVLGVSKASLDHVIKKLRRANLIGTHRREDALACRIADSSRGFVDALFEGYRRQLDWDGPLRLDAKNLAEVLDQRVRGWCCHPGKPEVKAS